MNSKIKSIHNMIIKHNPRSSIKSPKLANDKQSIQTH